MVYRSYTHTSYIYCFYFDSRYDYSMTGFAQGKRRNSQDNQTDR